MAGTTGSLALSGWWKLNYSRATFERAKKMSSEVMVLCHYQVQFEITVLSNMLLGLVSTWTQ